MKQSKLIQTLKEFTEELRTKAIGHNEIGEEHLRRSPADGSWNVLECYEHMNRFGKLYLGYTEEALIKAPLVKNDPEYRPGLVGGWCVRSMEPQEIGVKMPMKTFKSMDPLNDSISPLVIAQFVKQQEGFLEILERARKVDIDKVKCRTTLKLLKFKLSDALYFNTNHNRRHMLQIQRILFND